MKLILDAKQFVAYFSRVLTDWQYFCTMFIVFICIIQKVQSLHYPKWRLLCKSKFYILLTEATRR